LGDVISKCLVQFPSLRLLHFSALYLPTHACICGAGVGLEDGDGAGAGLEDGDGAGLEDGADAGDENEQKLDDEDIHLQAHVKPQKSAARKNKIAIAGTI
jgi:hypothetical protein